MLAFDIEHIDELGDSVSYRYEFNVPNYLSRAGEFYIFKIPWPDVLSTDKSISYQSRNFPIRNYTSSDTLHANMEIIFPDNLEPLSLPEAKIFTDPSGDYSVHYALTDTGIRCSRQLVYKKNSISVDDYTDYKQFYDQILKADEEQILLKVIK